jgi:hypothetical protein
VSGNFNYVDLEVLHPIIQGMTFSPSKPRVLIRTAERALVHVPGYSSYTSRMVPTHSYSPTALWRFMRRGDSWRYAKKIETGRITPTKLREIGAKIDELMGEEEIWKLIDLKRTLVLGDNPPWNGQEEGEDALKHKLGYQPSR